MKKQRFLAFLCAFLSLCSVLAQNFDADLEDLAKELAKKIDSKNKTKVALWGFFPENDSKNTLGNFLSEDFSIYLADHAHKFVLIDRAHLKVILKEHRLNFEGHIDEKTAKRLGKILAADAVIVGTYTVLSSELRLRVRVLDTETALQVAGAIGTLPMNDDIARLLGKL